MVTEKSVKELEGSQIDLTMTVDAESLEKAYQEKIQKYSKEIQVKGFRKGKAPLKVIEAKYGDEIRNESTFDRLEEELKDVISGLEDSKKPLPYSTPTLQDEEKLIPFKKDTAVTFTVRYDVYPTITLSQYVDKEVSYVDSEITDADVDKEVEVLRDQNAMVKVKDGAIENGDIVTIDYYYEDGKESEAREDFTFTVGSSYNYYGIDDDVIGMKKGEEKTFEKTYSEENDVEELRGKTINLHVKVDEVKTRELPEVDDEFAQDVKDEYQTVKDMRDGIRKELESHLEIAIKNEKIANLMNIIEGETKFDVPASMVRVECESEWRDRIRSIGFTKETYERYMNSFGITKESALKGMEDGVRAKIRRDLIISEIGKKEDFKVEDEKVKEMVKSTVGEVKDKDASKFYEDNARDQLVYEKAVEYLLEKNAFKAEKKVPYEEFVSSMGYQG